MTPPAGDAEPYRREVDASISFLRRDLDFFARAKAQHVIELARSLGDTRALRLLDVGCGIGTVHRFLADSVGSLHGVDVVSEPVARAACVNPGVRYVCSDGRSLPYDRGAFDLAFAVNVLHHLASDERALLVAEMRRVTRPRGLVVVFEHNPFNPLTRLAVSRCRLDDDATLVTRGRTAALLRRSGLTVVTSRYVTFFPWDGARARGIERKLAWLPLGAQYLVAARVD